MSKTIIVKKENKKVVKPQEYKKWSTEEVEYLKKNYKLKSNFSLSKTLGRTIPSIAIKAKSLGLTAKHGNSSLQVITEVVKPLKAKNFNRTEWTKDEMKFLKENYGKMPFAQMAEEMGRSIGSISGKAFWMKLSTKKGGNAKVRKAWTEEEIKYLKENYGKKSNKQLAKKLGRTFYSITSKFHAINGKNEESSVQSAKELPAHSNTKGSFNPLSWVIGSIVTLNVLTLASLIYLILVH